MIAGAGEERRRLQLSCRKVTVLVEVEHGRIVAAAPFVRKFTGQRLDVLLYWLSAKFGPTKVTQL